MTSEVTFGKDKDGNVQHWPDKSYLKVKVPAPLEQFLEVMAARGFVGDTPEKVAVYLIREGIAQNFKGKDFVPNKSRYVKKGKKRK